MSNAANTKLMLEMRKEKLSEDQAMQEIYDMMDEDARNRDLNGLVGSFVGAAVGFGIGGFQGAYVGYNLGGNLAYAAPQEFDPSDLDDPRLEGGLFDPLAMDSFKDDVLYADAAEDIAMYQDTVGDLFSVAMNYSKLPGKGESWDKIAETFKV